MIALWFSWFKAIRTDRGTWVTYIKYHLDLNVYGE